MYPFWSNIYDDYKDRRYGAIFLVTFFTLLGALALGAAIEAIAQVYFNELFPFFMVVAVISTVSLLWLAWNWVRGWKRHEERLKFAALSRDELAKARSKLKKETKPAAFRRERRPARLVTTRVPDTDLKY
jgi:hypothetical protein